MAKQGNKPDYILAAIVGLLVFFGIIILASASTSVPEEKFGSIYYMLNHQLLFSFIPGVLFGLMSLKAPLSFFKKKAPLFLLVSIILMIMVFLPSIGMKSGRATRWIILAGFSLQPSEFLKLSFILYLASWLESKSKKIFPERPDKKFEESLVAFLVIIALMCILLYLQSDISTLGVIIATAVLMYFLSGTPLWHTALIVLIGAIGLIILVNVAPYRLERISVFLNPGIEPMGIGYQIKQSLIAVGSGKILGSGLGLSKQKFGLLPYPMSDSIFAILAEETGFLGSFVLTFLFLLFLWRGYKIGKESPDMFSQLTAFGITSWIIIQAFVSIGSMIGILPLTGIPLPFISYGGTALFVELIAVGIMLNISKTT
jgi:cell division protein FtsW